MIPKPLNWENVGRRIGRLIGERYGSVSRFSSLLGLSSAAVYRNVHGTQKPSVESLLLYRECLGCSLDTLLGLIRPDRDAGTAWRESIERIRRFRRQWKPEDRFRIACFVSGMIPEEAEQELKKRIMDSDQGGWEKGDNQS